ESRRASAEGLFEAEKFELRPGERVRALAMAGRLQEARKLLASIGAGSERAQLEVKLDLQEAFEEQSWPSLLRKIKLLLPGDEAPFFFRSAYIYALIEGRDYSTADVELMRLSQLSEKKKAPLYPQLASLVQVAIASPSLRQLGRSETGRVETGRLETGDAVAVSAAEPRAAAEDEPLAPTSRPSEPTQKVKKKEAKQKDRAGGSSAQGVEPQSLTQAEALSTKADTLWNHGDHQGAVELYRQIVQAIGTKHFIGQRAAARIAHVIDTQKK
ncbi:MAG: hypothetical protein MK135_14210, partial [Polyangiaceae bacterium]|nr:hypothetical protein [Polyangiaceae bacterium]